MKPWSIFREIKAALDSEDIEGLLALGCPTDEYDGEASLIEDRIAKATNFGEKTLSVAQVEDIVGAVWNFTFGPFEAGNFERRRSAFSSVARKIAK
jgi:hypothetical protein